MSKIIKNSKNILEIFEKNIVFIELLKKLYIHPHLGYMFFYFS